MLRAVGGVLVAVLLVAGVAPAAHSSPSEGESTRDSLEASPSQRAARTYTYSVAVRGTVRGDVGEFKAIAGETMADPRGWSLGGSIAYREVASGGDFTLWLSEAAQVPSFSSICSASWSCRVGDNVIINDDRWMYGTSRPGTLRDYRSYVINHELGHWLGLGHWSCPGAGQPAAVMQQQSKGLDGCVANTWPLLTERQAVGRIHGVPVGPTTPPTSPFGNLEVARGIVGGFEIGGWVGDPDAPGHTLLHIRTRDGVIATTWTGQPRADVQRAHPTLDADTGFRHVVPAPPGTRDVCVWAINRNEGSNRQIGCARLVTPNTGVDPFGVVDVARGGAGSIDVGGWAIDPDHGGPTSVHVYRGTKLLGGISASGPRVDAAARFGISWSSVGFRKAIAAPKGAYVVCVIAINHAQGSHRRIGCPRVTVV